MFVLIPIVYPIAKLLDLMLGTHEATFYRSVPGGRLLVAVVVGVSVGVL